MSTRKRERATPDDGKQDESSSEHNPPEGIPLGMEVREFPIGELRAAEYNPRRMTLQQKVQLRDSLEEFGLVEPLIVNLHPSRSMVVVGGHQRLEILKEQGRESCHAVVVSLPLEKEKKLNLRLNKNNGEWDLEKLGEFFDSSELHMVGFTDDEVGFLFRDSDTDKDEEGGNSGRTSPQKLQFSPRLNYTQEYFLVTCESVSEREAIQARLDLPDVRSSTGSARGLQRIIPAKEFLAKL